MATRRGGRASWGLVALGALLVVGAVAWWRSAATSEKKKTQASPSTYAGGGVSEVAGDLQSAAGNVAETGEGESPSWSQYATALEEALGEQLTNPLVAVENVWNYWTNGDGIGGK